MADINVLMVLDGGRFNYGPKQPSTDLDADYFGVTGLIGALQGATTPTIQVDKAHRRGYTFSPNSPSYTSGTEEDCSVGLSPAYQGDFVFAPPVGPHQVTADLSQYDVLWMIGDEGLNDGAAGTLADSVITDDEKIAIAKFMASGGGVFAVGDHDGIGSDMSGYLPRVRTMRRWFDYHQASATPNPFDAGNGQVFQPNWNAEGLDSSLPSQPDRNDTLQPDATDGLFYFNDQSDEIAQTLRDVSATPLTSSAGPIHPILRDENGQIVGSFPDHMHEGEATDFTSVSASGSPFNPNLGSGQPYSLTFNGTSGTVSFPEFPVPYGFQAEPEVIAYDHDSGHGTYDEGYTGPKPTYASTAAKTRGAISVYDGRPSGVGRIITGSTFHHYLDKNLTGDPQTNTYETSGHGPTNSVDGLPTSVRAGIGAYYVNAVTWLARPNTNFEFWILKNTFGVNEAPQSLTNAFYLVLEGYPLTALSPNPPIVFSGPLAAAGLTFSALPIEPDDPSDQTNPQRILLPYTVNPIPGNAFPGAGGAPKELALEARLTLASGQTLAAEGLFELTASVDPFFSNVGGSPPNEPYLSQDLRVFQAGPNAPSTPFIPFPPSGSGYDYITQLLDYLNTPSHGFTNGTAPDPFLTLNELNDLTEASSVTPSVQSFAVARVRLWNTVNATASNVRVFFRLFTTASNDTDYDPVVTYPSLLDAANLPSEPQPGLLGTTFPMTASGAVATDFGPNEQSSISVTANQEAYAFFGCYLDVYGPNSPIPDGGHHCLVAQIAYDKAPIINSNGLTVSPENSEKLAQRNIVFTPSGNPGGPAAHRVPQTFDTRPSVRTAAPAGTPAGYPDELMIDWGEVPIGSTASLYWPQAAAIDVVRLATLLYPSHGLSVADAHTVQCTVSPGLTYVPIPFGSGKLAGLFTIDLPLGVRRGQEFKVVVRRIGTRTVPGTPVIATRAKGRVSRTPINPNWRYVVGTFQVTIPVELEGALLLPEENVLAIFKWRLQHTLPSNRWYPVLQRYLSYLIGRVNAFGGNAGSILPSPTGVPIPHGHNHHPGHGEVEHTGKVCGVAFDRFGDFEGFELETFVGRDTFRSHEPEIGNLVMRAARERLLLSVFADGNPHHVIRRIIVRG